MEYKEIYISNVLEGYYKGHNMLPVEEKRLWYEYDYLESNRALLYGSDNKIVVTSKPIEPLHIVYMKRIMKWQHVENWFPKTPQPALSLNILEDQELYKQLVNVIKANPGIKVIQYLATPEFYKFITKLKSEGLEFTTPELAYSENEFVVSYFHSKRGFRHLWYSSMGENRSDINIPEGFIVGSKTEAIQAAWWFRSHNRDFVIKFNRGVQGIGVVLNNASDFSENQGQFSEELRTKLSEDIWNDSPIIVEELINPEPTILGGSPSPDFEIDENGEVKCLYFTEQILENKKKFIGVQIYPELAKTPQLIAAREAGLKIGQLLARYGYRGKYDMDLVINREGKVFAVEINMRRNGGTHAYEGALSLLGKERLNRAHIMILDLHLSEPVAYSTMMTKMEPVLWQESKGEGIILANPDLMKVKVFVPIIIANSSERVKVLKNQVEDLLNGWLD